MRDIKFRVWNPLTKEMIIVEKTEFLGGTGLLDGGVHNDKGVWQGFTGLKDINGKEIYEGDIVEYQYKTINDEVKTVLFTVVYQLGCFYCKERGRILSSSIGTYTTLARGNSLKLVGNIYENKDLLEG